MKSALLYLSSLCLLGATAACGSSDPAKQPNASGVTPEQEASATAAFRSGHFQKSKPGKYEFEPVKQKPSPDSK